MMLAPRYDGPTVLSIEGPADDQLVPFRRQRQRMMAMLAGAHGRAVEVGQSLRGLDGEGRRRSPCRRQRVLALCRSLPGSPERPRGCWVGFDPATTPPMLVDRMTALSPSEVFDQFVSTSEALLDIVSDLSDDQWSTLAESPGGHVPIRLVVQHALWDCWVHERDIAVPLDIAPATDTDELQSCLRYAAAIGAVLGLGLGNAPSTVVAVEATNPAIQFIVEVDESVSLRDGGAAGVPCLHGDALALAEALSLRAPMPTSIPAEWSLLLAGLATAFDAVAT